MKLKTKLSRLRKSTPRNATKEARAREKIRGKRKTDRNLVIKNPRRNSRTKRPNIVGPTARNIQHTSSECKLMAGDKAQFNDSMRSAKDADHLPGGSTKVLGQEPK